MTLPNIYDWGHQLSRHIVPLFTLVKRKSTSVGTGFFLKDGTDHYLVSAAHVFDKVLENFPLFYFSDVRTMRIVRGYVRQTLSAIPKDRHNDRLDIGIVHLTEPLLPPYQSLGIESLSVSNLAHHALPRFGKQYILTGYPASKCNRNPVTKRVESRALAFSANSVPQATYDQVGLSTKTHIVIPFDPKRVADEHGKPASIAKPTGLSGSPLWMIEYVPTSYLTARLVGVMIEHRKPQRVLVATDASVILGLLKMPRVAGPEVKMDWPLRPGE